MIDINPTFQTLLTFFGFAGVVAVIFVSFRSKLPTETIRVQGENIAALQERSKENHVLIQELKTKVTQLEAENRLLRDIPLNDIKTTQEKILHLLEVQNEILLKITE